MNINQPVNYSVIGTNVWSVTPRTLTSTPPIVFADTGISNQTLAAGTVLDMRLGTGILGFVYIAASNPAAVTSSIGAYDGTTFIPGQSILASASGAQMGISLTSVGMALKNLTGVGVVTYSYATATVN